MTTIIRVLVVLVQKISTHPHAERLDIATFRRTDDHMEYDCVIKKDSMKEGTLAIHFPHDAVLPEELCKKLELVLKYGRVTITKIRKIISQGILISPQDLDIEPSSLIEGQDLTGQLQVTKYEQPLSPQDISADGFIGAPPETVVYDLNNISAWYEYAKKQLTPEQIEQSTVTITEKVDGSNFRAVKLDGVLYVGSHRRFLTRDENNPFWREAIRYDLEHVLPENIILFGELLGPKFNGGHYKNIREQTLMIYDAYNTTTQRYLTWNEFTDLLSKNNISVPVVPVLYRGIFDSAMIAATYINKKSEIYHNIVHEGIVLKFEPPGAEPESFKWKSKVYLAEVGDEGGH